MTMPHLFAVFWNLRIMAWATIEQKRQRVFKMANSQTEALHFPAQWVWVRISSTLVGAPIADGLSNINL